MLKIEIIYQYSYIYNVFGRKVGTDRVRFVLNFGNIKPLPFPKAVARGSPSPKVRHFHIVIKKMV